MARRDQSIGTFTFTPTVLPLSLSPYSGISDWVIPSPAPRVTQNRPQEAQGIVIASGRVMLDTLVPTQQAPNAPNAEQLV